SYLQRLLSLDEGVRNHPYTDTVGKVSIGIGRNLTDVGLSEDEVQFLFENDVRVATVIAQQTVSSFNSLSLVRQMVLIDMTFNLGHRLSLFQQTIAEINNGDYEKAAKSMLASVWAKQVGDRAIRLAEMMRTGIAYQFPTGKLYY
ncbi:MAG: glycoside hydrolase family protein, partial [Candidatus Dormibacteria bacterium]